jgi:hypothetical protein
MAQEVIWQIISLLQGNMTPKYLMHEITALTAHVWFLQLFPNIHATPN